MRGASPVLHCILMLLSGALAVLSFAPFNWPLFALISVAAAFLILDRSRNSWLSGWCFGTGFFGAGVSWVYVSIHEHGGMGALSAALMTALFCIALGTLFALQFGLYKRLFTRPNLAGFAALWIGFEWLRSWLFTGFPWLYLGYGWIDTPLANLAPIGGVWLVSSAALLIALLVAQALQKRCPHRLITAALIYGSASLLPTLFPNSTLTPDTASDEIKLAVIQPNIEQSLKWKPDQFDNHISNLVTLSAEAPDAEWVIWPETAVPREINTALPAISNMLNEIEQRNQTLISGFPRREWSEDAQRWIYLNSLGTLTGTPVIYDKRRLVPFGEYLPLERWLRGAIAFFDLPMSSFSLPDKPKSSIAIEGQAIMAAICYEIAYPELVREGVNSGAELILTLSNDTWFSGSHGPAQHLQIARMRALENQRWLIRATNNGHSAIINPRGKVTASVPSESRQVLRASVWPLQSETAYQRYGSAPVLLGWLAALLISLIYTGRRGSLKHQA